MEQFDSIKTKLDKYILSKIKQKIRCETYHYFWSPVHLKIVQF